VAHVSTDAKHHSRQPSPSGDGFFFEKILNDKKINHFFLKKTLSGRKEIIGGKFPEDRFKKKEPFKSGAMSKDDADQI